MPETNLHLELRTVLYQILKFWCAERASVGSDQFVYWDPTDPGQRLAPDVFVRIGPRQELFDSWKIWERGAPHVGVEIVSQSDATELRWEQKLERYQRAGIQEVVRFDPNDSKQRLRIWDNVSGDLVERELEQAQLAASIPLGLFWVVVDDERLGPMLRLAEDARCERLVPTPLEAEVAARKAEAAARQAEAAARQVEAAARQVEAAARQAAEQRVRELEEELRRRG